jgi:hypothetical protein
MVVDDDDDDQIMRRIGILLDINGYKRIHPEVSH